MIPKKIHYCWFGGKKLPKDVKKCIKSWKKYCPDYEIIQWNESNFDVYQHPFIKAAYDNKAWAFVSDFARLKIIFDNGGIYLDTDVELLKNLDFLLKNKFYIGSQQCENVCNTGLGFGAEKNNDIVEKMLKEYDEIVFDKNHKERLACPYLNTKVLKNIGYKYTNDIQYLKDAVIFPPKYFDPLSPGETSDLLCKDTISIHHYTATWANSNTKMKRRIINLIGQKNINKLKKIIKRK